MDTGTILAIVALALSVYSLVSLMCLDKKEDIKFKYSKGDEENTIDPSKINYRYRGPWNSDIPMTLYNNATRCDICKRENGDYYLYKGKDGATVHSWNDADWEEVPS
jgi:hypothetical protein